jgi:hypothetical protein
MRRMGGGARRMRLCAMAQEGNERPRLETASAVVLSLAALASSWAVYQASLWEGEEASQYSRTNALRIQASRAALEGDALASAELQTFGAWLEATARGDRELAAFYQARFPAGLRMAFDAWMADDPMSNPKAPPTPFATSDYRRPGQAASRRLDQQADASYAAGRRANRLADAFQQSSTVLAVALFFGGIGQVFSRTTPRLVLLAVACLALLAGSLRLLSLPMQILGLHVPPT